MMFRSICYVVCVIGLLVLESMGTDIPRSGDVIDSLITGREDIYSGDVTIRGRQVRVSHGKEPESVIEIQDRVMFDLRLGVSRQEKATPLSPEFRKDGRSNYLHEVRVNGIDSSFSKSVEAKQIVIGPRTEERGIWDLRTFGLCTYDDLINLNDLRAFQLSFQRFNNRGAFTVQETDEPGVLVASMTFGYDITEPSVIHGRRQIWISVRDGFTPFRLQEQFKVVNPSDGNQGEDEWQRPHAHATTEWTEISGVWVPVTGTIELLTRLPDGNVVSRIAYELNFEWNDLNSEFDPQLFSLEGLDIPQGSHIISDRRNGGDSVLAQHPNVPDAEMLQSLESLRGRSSGAPSRMTSRWLGVALVTVILLGTTGIIVYIFVIPRGQ